METELEGKRHEYLLEPRFWWSEWAVPRKDDGTIDHDNALIGDDLRDFVNRELFPYLEGFKQRASGPDTIAYKIGEIFGEIRNKIQSGYNLRDIIESVDELSFGSQKEKHELSHLYEAKIKNMGNAGRNGGEYYTPRPLIRAIISVVDPQLGETIYDGAAGSAGFLCEAYDYLRSHHSHSSPNSQLSTKDLEIFQTKTFFAKEKKSLAYVIGIMNLILHGIEARTSSTPTRLRKTSRTFRKRIDTTSCWRTHPSAARSARRCSRTSPSAPGRRPSSSSSIS
jgi:type I restriction enzyme M protein